VLYRLSALVLALVLALAGAACGGDEADPAQAQPAGLAEVAGDATAILVTQGCGEQVVVPKTEVDPGQTAIQALDRVADIKTDSGGLFVTAIEGVEQDEDAQLAWLYYVNGVEADKGAAEVTLAEGDVEWWDLHDWETTCEIPAEAR
jgi:Domain of unknown function (DUF4430)